MKTSKKNKTHGNHQEEKGSSSTIRKKSVLEHVEAQLSQAETKTFIYRMTIVGSHEGPPEEVMKLNEDVVSEINAACYDEPATGLFAAYQNYFLHVIEGSEDTLNKYISRKEFDDTPMEEESEHVNKNVFNVKMKILCFIRVFTRSIDKWIPVMRNDSGDYDVETRVPGFRNRLFEFIKSSWILASVFPIFTQPQDVSPPQHITDFPDHEDQLRVVEAEKNLKIDLEVELNKYFPTVETLHYFMKPKMRLPPLRTPKEHMERSWELPKIIFDSETVWPIPCRFAPYD